LPAPPERFRGAAADKRIRPGRLTSPEPEMRKRHTEVGAARVVRGRIIGATRDPGQKLFVLGRAGPIGGRGVS
jgi:hypothetical protein